MALQKIFKDSYAAELLQNVKNGNVDAYKAESFVYDESKLVAIPLIDQPVGLLNKMNPDPSRDFESAKALFEAYPNLSLLQASHDAFWITLAHTDLYQYVRNRWPNVKNDDCNKQYILDHWFFGKNYMRSALSGLWWAVKCTAEKKEDGSYDYGYTEFLFRDNTFRTRQIGASTLFRHKEYVIGIIKFLMEDKEVSSTSFENRTHFIAKYFNKLGGARQLTYLDRDFYYNELKRIRKEILKINSREDLKLIGMDFDEEDNNDE